MNRFTIHGARGSYPVHGERFSRYGGSTSCYSFDTPEGLLIIDAGTGLAALSASLPHASVPHVTILLTHVHLDHIIGIPSFKPLLRAGVE
ncbi:MAG: MBL fold metallo-hydrolase, partial [Gemmatimonadetes bacterium]|nr:MBL fold metallo-hydrolase [Gemmatimonadota bacterium]